MGKKLDNYEIYVPIHRIEECTELESEFNGKEKIPQLMNKLKELKNNFRELF